MIPYKIEGAPIKKTPIVLGLLLMSNLGAFTYQIMHPGTWLDYSAVPRDILLGVDLHTMLTSMFLHGGTGHLFGNMFFLWVFGRHLEDLLGHVRFLLLYLLAGIGAVMAHTLIYPTSGVAMIGASGAIAGLMGAFVILLPVLRVKVLLLLGPIPVPIRVPVFAFLILWMGFQYLMASYESDSPIAVAYWAHVGGFGVGMNLALASTWKRWYSTLAIERDQEG